VLEKIADTLIVSRVDSSRPSARRTGGFNRMTPFPSGTAVPESCIHQFNVTFNASGLGVLEGGATASETQVDAMIRPDGRFLADSRPFAEVLPGGKRKSFYVHKPKFVLSQAGDLPKAIRAASMAKVPFTHGVDEFSLAGKASRQNQGRARDSCMGATRGILR